MFGKKEYSSINRRLNDELQEKQCLVAVHRGTPGGNIIENTVEAYHVALQLQADMLEIDISRTKDGDYFLLHDGEEERLFRTERHVEDMTTEELTSYPYYNSIGLRTHSYIQPMNKGLQFLKGKTLINVDRSWNYWPELLSEFDDYDMQDQLLLKSPVDKPYLEALQAFPTKYMYMPIIKSKAELEEVLCYEHINLVGVEIIASSSTSELFDNEWISYLHSLGLFVWVNAITLDDETILYGGYDDNLSLLKGMNEGWGALMDKDVDIIQTDWPSLLVPYRNEKKTHIK